MNESLLESIRAGGAYTAARAVARVVQPDPEARYWLDVYADKSNEIHRVLRGQIETLRAGHKKLWPLVRSAPAEQVESHWPKVLDSMRGLMEEVKSIRAGLKPEIPLEAARAVDVASAARLVAAGRFTRSLATSLDDHLRALEVMAGDKSARSSIREVVDLHDRVASALPDFRVCVAFANALFTIRT